MAAIFTEYPSSHRRVDERNLADSFGKKFLKSDKIQHCRHFVDVFWPIRTPIWQKNRQYYCLLPLYKKKLSIEALIVEINPELCRKLNSILDKSINWLHFLTKLPGSEENVPTKVNLGWFLSILESRNKPKYERLISSFWKTTSFFPEWKEKYFHKKVSLFLRPYSRGNFLKLRRKCLSYVAKECHHSATIKRIYCKILKILI